MRILCSICLLIAFGFALTGCGASPEEARRKPKDGDGAGSKQMVAEGERPRVAYVTNGIASFWTIAQVGAEHAGKDFDADVEVLMPPDGLADQKRMIEDVLVSEIDGIAISPIDPVNQLDFINRACEQTNVITHDSDAEGSKRLCYVGMSNYDAGRQCGQLVKKALPDGGEIMIFVGRLEQLNAQLRRQGLIDELMDRSHDPTRVDDNVEIKNEKYTILGTRTDQFDFAQAKSLPEDTLTKNPDVDCMVGLFAYNPPYILEALKGAGKIGEVKVVGFDEDDATLQAIVDGQCYGTVVQDPYRYGYESVRILAALARGDDSVIEKEFIDIPARQITKENVEEFWAELKSRLEGATPDAAGAGK